MNFKPLFCPTCKRHFEESRAICPNDGTSLVRSPDIAPKEGNVLDGKLILLEKIGKGGMATVFRALDLPAKRECAVKILKVRYAKEEGAVNQFFLEARTAKSLNHPNIVKVFEFGRTSQGYLYISMELLKGHTLASEIRANAPLPLPKAMKIFSQMVDALIAAHSHDTVHRDLKPENVFLCNSESEKLNVKLLDFGIAALAGKTLEGQTEICGTPAYMSPEQIRSYRNVCSSSDLYSAGVILFEMLAGVQPFKGKNYLEILKAHLRTPAPRLSKVCNRTDIPQSIDVLVAKLLAKNPANRFASAQQLKQEMKKAINGVVTLESSPESAQVHNSREENKQQRKPGILFGLHHGTSKSALLKPTSAGLTNRSSYRIKYRYITEQSSVSEPNTAHADQQVTGLYRPRYSSEAIANPNQQGVMATRCTMLHARILSLDGTSFTTQQFELVRQSLEPTIERWKHYVEQLGGVICIDEGDQLRALFGLLQQQSSAPTAATMAAYKLAEGIKAAGNRTMTWAVAQIGIATAQVFMDTDDPGPPHWATSGSKVELSVRLSRLAPPGGIVLCECTAKEVQDDYNLLKLAVLRIRGTRAPVSTYLVMPRSDIQTTADALPQTSDFIPPRPILQPGLEQTQ